jgi:hypothetical protein
MLDKPAALALIMKKRSGDELPPEELGDEDPQMGLKASMEDLLSAIEARDPEMMLGALKAFFDLSESLPHEEYSEESEEEEPSE